MLVILINDIAVFQRRKPLLLDQLGNARIQHAADLRAFQYLEFLPVVHAERGDAVAGGVKDLFLKRIRFMKPMEFIYSQWVDLDSSLINQY